MGHGPSASELFAVSASDGSASEVVNGSRFAMPLSPVSRWLVR